MERGHIIGHALVSNPMAQLGRTTTWYIFTAVLLVAVDMLHARERMVVAVKRAR